MLAIWWTRLLTLNLMPFVYAGIAAVILAAVVFMVDAIGDRREAAVWARINRAIEKTNVDVAKYNTLDDKIAAIAYEGRIKALAAAKRSSDTKFVVTQEQADALNRIK